MGALQKLWLRLRDHDPSSGEPWTPQRFPLDNVQKPWWVILAPLWIPLLILGGLWALGEYLLR